MAESCRPQTRLCTPQISWHGREPVLSVDISPDGLVATAGSDNEVRLWRISLSATETADLVTFVQELNSHAKVSSTIARRDIVGPSHTSTVSQPVNAVRFNPTGDTLASASDDTMITLWKDKDNKGDGSGCNWGPVSILRGHCADVYDLCWSPDGQVPRR